jgi:hypothetical protein
MLHARQILLPAGHIPRALGARHPLALAPTIPTARVPPRRARAGSREGEAGAPDYQQRGRRRATRDRGERAKSATTGPNPQRQANPWRRRGQIDLM